MVSTNPRESRRLASLLFAAIAALGLAGLMPAQTSALFKTAADSGPYSLWLEAQPWMMLVMMLAQGALALLLVAGVVKERFLKRPSLVFMAVLFGVAAALRLYFGVETGDWQWPLTRTELYLALVTPAALATARWRVSEDPREDTHD